MTKILLVISLLLINFMSFSQTQKYWSNQRFYTESGYTEQFDDTTLILLTHNNECKILTIKSIYIFKKFDLYTPLKEYINTIGFKIVTYEIIDKNIPLTIEFLYRKSTLLQITFVEPKAVTCFVVHFLNDFI